MADKINLAMQDQYVAYAEKDGEGKGIAESIDILQQAIEGKVVFDGEILIDSHGSPYLSQTEYNRLIALPHAKYFMRPNKRGGFYNFIAYVDVSSYGAPQSNKNRVQIFMIYWDNGNVTTYYKTYHTDSTYDGEFTRKNFVPAYNLDNAMWDATPTENSTKPCISGGIYSAIARKIAFDGEVLIEQPGANPVIHKVSQGLYKVKKGTNWVLDGIVLVGSNGYFIGYLAPRFIGSTQNVVITGQFDENETVGFNISSVATKADVGTKLYKHSLSITLANSTASVKVILPFSSQITSSNAYSAFDKSLQACNFTAGSDTEFAYLLITAITNNKIVVITRTISGSTITEACELSDTFTDTVTAL